MRINNQAQIAFSVNRYSRNEKVMEKTIDKLATGQAIRRAGDNASGLAISETMRAQIRGLSQAQRNMQDGLSVLQAADEGLNNVNGLLQRARELAVMNANGTLTAEDRAASQKELDQLMEGINDTASKLEFNTKKILGENAPLVLMVGANPGQKISVDLVDTSTTALGLNGSSIATQADAANLISKLDTAIEKTSGHMTKIGAFYEAVEHHMRNSLVNESNITASLSNIADTDMAKEMMGFVSSQIRQNSDQFLVSKVNQTAGETLQVVKN